MKIAIIVSQFNQELTSRLYEGAIVRLSELGVNQDTIKTVRVPGAVEIPIVAQELALQKKCDVIICLGAVVRGETDHYDYVCQQVSYGCQRVALNNRMPIIF